MRIIEQLVYLITGDNTKFDKSIDKSESIVDRFGKVANKIFAGVTVAAIGKVVKKMGDIVISSANALDRVDKLSQKIGLSRTAFQEWDYIIGQSGASVEGLQMSLKTLSGAADEASKGNKQYKDSFDKLGVSVTDVNGNMKDQEALFSEVFSALADMENQTERTALASDLLGRSATELAPTLNTSKEDIENSDKKHTTLGLSTPDELVDAGVVLGDNIDRLKKSFGALKTKALAPIIGLAVTFTDKLLGQYSASGKLKTSYNNLTQAAQDYNTVLEASKGKTDAVTQATLSQAKAQLQLALQKASEAYRESSSELEKYNNTIQNSEKWVDKYDKILGQIAQGTGYTTEQLNLMTEQERLTAIAMAKGVDEADRYNTTLGFRRGYQEDLIEATTNLSQAEASQENFINLLTQGYVANNEVTNLLLDAYPELKAAVIGNVEAYKKEQEAIEAEKKATEDAAEAFKAYENATSEEISTAIKLLGLEEKTLANGKLIEMLQKKKIELAGEVAKAAADEAGKEKARNEIIEAGNKAMELAEQYALALGSSYDLNAEKASILETTIKALIDSGLTAEDKAVADLTAQLQALETTTEDVTDATVAAYAEIEKSRMSDKEKAFKAIQDQADAYLKAGVAKADVDQWQSEQVQKYQDEETKTRTDAYKLLESYSLSAKEKAIANIQAQADKFLEAGVSEVDVEKWKTNELEKLQEEQTKKAKEEAEKVRKAWEDATFSMLNSVTSIWSSINQVQANANEEEIRRIEEQNAIAIQAAKDRGASEEEVTALEESLQADLNDAKNKYAQEEAERNKALSTLSVILDTAKAIMQIWADPLISPWGKGLWTGLAAGAGAAQIAAINSAPMPSYDVGSIRIPETTTATVHKDEMILTAPQAEQARQEGITIAPTKGSGNSITLVIYLDGKEIAKNTIDNLNSGSVGTIKAKGGEMRISYDNLLKTATLTATNENGNYPIENVYHRWQRKTFKATTTSVITAILDDVVSLSSVILDYHNLTSCSVAFYDYADALIDTWTMDVSYNCSAQYGTVADVAKVVLTCESIVDIEIGTIFIGDSLYFPIQANQDIPLKSSDVVSVSSDRQTSGRKGSVTRAGTITIPLLTSTERKSIENVFYEMGLIEPFFIDLWDNSHTDFEPIYGTFTSEISVTHLEEGDTISFSFEEAN